jgi:hypothetical protein
LLPCKTQHMSMSYTYTYFDPTKYPNRTTEKRCVIQPGRRVHQLSTIDTFTCRWVTNTSGTCFIFLLICHWQWIWWQRNPMLEIAQRRRIIPIMREKKNLWIKCLGSINSLKESTPILLGQEKQTCKYQITQYSYMWNTITHTLVRVTVVSMSGHAWMSWLLDVSLFAVLTSQNGKMRRNRCIETTSVRVVIPIIWYVNNKFKIIWHVNNTELRIFPMS